VHWRPKSESVADILQVWNIAADAVVFIDDNPMELAEVKAAHPGIECVRFPKDAGELPDLIGKLRTWFGKSELSAEDLLRGESIRAGAVWREAGTGPNDSFEAFLSNAGARLKVEAGPSAELGRPFELVNKTNQFNLNGRRYTEADWLRYLAQPGAFLATIAYEDKFGPLGVISVALGRIDEATILLDAWVLSCRAFGRRVEYQFINTLFGRYPVDEIVLDFLPTERNHPTAEFLCSFGTPGPSFRIAKDVFGKACPALYFQ
jgi:FkbH-like protein